MAKLTRRDSGWLIETSCGYQAIYFGFPDEAVCQWCLKKAGPPVVIRLAFFPAEGKVKELWAACAEHRHYVEESVNMTKANCEQGGYAHYEIIELRPRTPMLWRHQ